MFLDFSRSMFIISFKLSGFEMYFVITWIWAKVINGKRHNRISTIAHRKVVTIQQKFAQKLQTLTTSYVVLRV